MHCIYEHFATQVPEHTAVSRAARQGGAAPPIGDICGGLFPRHAVDWSVLLPQGTPSRHCRRQYTHN